MVPVVLDTALAVLRSPPALPLFRRLHYFCRGAADFCANTSFLVRPLSHPTASTLVILACSALSFTARGILIIFSSIYLALVWESEESENDGGKTARISLLVPVGAAPPAPA